MPELPAFGPEPSVAPAPTGKPNTPQASTGDYRSAASTGSGDAPVGGISSPASVPRSRFTILKPHAQGGLGQVSLARDEQLGRTVALKEIRPDKRDNQLLRRRFLNEAEITGELEHPGIVPVYALEADDLGEPYYAMRFIQGQTLAEAIREFHGNQDADESGKASARIRVSGFSSLEFRQLLQRFVAVCHTIAYAHSKSVIHRDLKPANVMLGDYGETLVLDWGLAKRLSKAEPQPQEGAATDHPAPVTAPPEALGDNLPTTVVTNPQQASTQEELTQAGQVLGTPAYMSPEQAAGHSEDVGPATDLYALGAILYELLTGRPPYRGSAREVLDELRAGPPLAPSDVRHTVPKPLEAACARAMARRPQQRYGSAADLARDIDRWLADEPVSAWREPWITRAGRWLRKHRTFTIASALTVVLALGFFVVLTGVLNLKNTELGVAYEGERTAKGRAIDAEAYARQALDDMTAQAAREWLIRGKQLTPEQRQFLQSAVVHYRRFTREEASDEASRVRLVAAHVNLGQLLSLVGQHQEAEPILREAVVLCDKLIADFPSSTKARHEWIAARLILASELSHVGRQTESLPLFRETVARLERLAADYPEDSEIRRHLATLSLQCAGLFYGAKSPAEAVGPFRQTIAMSRKLLDSSPDDQELMNALAIGQHNLAVLLQDAGQWDEATALYREVLILREKLAKATPGKSEYRQSLAESQVRLAHALSVLGNSAEAEAGFRQALTIRQQLADEFPSAPAYRNDLADTYTELGTLKLQANQWSEAESAFRQALALQDKLRAENVEVPSYARDAARSYHNLALLQERTGQAAAAVRSLEESRKVLEDLARRYPAELEYTKDLAYTLAGLGRLQAALGQSATAERSYKQALELQEKIVRAHPDVAIYANEYASTFTNLSMLQIQTDQRTAAFQSLEQACAIYEKLAGEHPGVVQYAQDWSRALNNRGALQARAGQTAAAFQSYEKVCAILEKLHRDHPEVPNYAFELAGTYANVGSMQLQTGEVAVASRSLEKARAMQEQLVRDHPKVPGYAEELARTYNSLGILHEGAGRHHDAIQSYEQGRAIKERLVRDHPENTEYAIDLGGIYCNLGNQVSGSDKPGAALDWYNKAVATLEAVVRRESKSYKAREYLRNSLAGRAQALIEKDRHADAVADLDRAIALDTGPMRPALQTIRARSLAHTGDHQRAMADVNEVAKAKNIPSEFLYNLAAACALSGVAAKDDTKLQEQYAVQALDLLRRAKNAGFFKNPEALPDLKKNTDFDSLRPREDFQKLLGELEGKQSVVRSPLSVARILTEAWATDN